MKYFVDHFSPAPAWPERAVVCDPNWISRDVDTFFDIGKTPPVPVDPGTADKVWGFDPKGEEVLASFGEDFPMADTITGDTSETPAICTNRGGKYGSSSAWSIVVIRCVLNPDKTTEENIYICHIVREDAPAIRRITTALGSAEIMRYCEAEILVPEGVNVFNMEFGPDARYFRRSAKRVYDYFVAHLEEENFFFLGAWSDTRLLLPFPYDFEQTTQK